MTTTKSQVSFEEVVEAYIWKHHLGSLDDIARRLAVPATSAKQEAASIVQRLIDDGPPEISVADLEVHGIHLKTVRAPQQGKGNKPFEPMTFPAFDPFVLAKETWETSELRSLLGRLLIVVTRGKKGQPQRSFKIDFGFFWSPAGEQLRTIQAEWEDVRRLVATGRADDLPKATDTHAIHVKPKGTAGTDRVDAPGGVRMARSGFALNDTFVEELIADA